MSFIDDIKALAKSDKKRIVLPEYMDSRTDSAAQTAPGGYQDQGYTAVNDEELPFDQ